MEILSPFRLQEQLTIETAECGAVNSYYERKNLKPTVTICYEFSAAILSVGLAQSSKELISRYPRTIDFGSSNR
jgi:hypothetical protein